VTEDEWLVCIDPQPMLEFLKYNASDRKLRLFGVACCRSIWHLITAERSRASVEVGERYTDGLATASETTQIHLVARDAIYDVSVNRFAADAASVCSNSRNLSASRIAQSVDWAVSVGNPDREVRVEKLREECAFLYCIFGNPFWSPTPITHEIRTWNDSIVARIAQGIYADRAFGRMPILHDALLDAGCSDEALLSHCRNPEGHVLGCWALDLILAKE
jgi:hypothetical protein